MDDRSRRTPRGPLAWISAGAPEPVRTARGLYLLKNWPDAAAALDGAGGLPGAGTILALAQARMGEREAALASFAAAVVCEPEEPHLRSAYAACLLRCGAGEAAAEQLEAVRPASHYLSPVWQSLRGAAHWLVGQESLASGAGRAAAQFERAAVAFAAAARHTATARRALPERLVASYLGQAVAMIAAEQFAAASQLFARRRAQGMMANPALSRFARDLYELCDLLPRLDAKERQLASAALRPILATAELSTQLWDGSHPVTLTWRGIGALEGGGSDA